MNNSTLLTLAAVLALGFAPALLAQPAAPAKPLTESELLKTIDGLGKGDPVTKAPLGADDQKDLPTGDAPKADAPRARKPKPGDPPDPNAPPQQTEITSEEGTFDSKTHIAVFTIKVFVKNPDFTVSCEKLTAYMKHDDDKAGGKKGAATPGSTPPKPGGAKPGASPAATPKAGPTRLAPPVVEASGAKVSGPGAAAKTDAAGNEKTDAASGLEKAIAEENVVITQDKVDDDGNVTHNVGHGKKAVYIAATGDITLSGKPDVQQGINTCVALDENTIIILNRDGHMKTIGPTKNIIRESTPTDKPSKSGPTTTVAPPNGR